MKTRYEELKRRSYKLGELLPGSLQTKWLTCGDPNCKCKMGEKHGPYYYLAFRDRETGRTTTVYVLGDELPSLKERIRNYEKFKDELWKLVEIEVKMKRRRAR